MKKYVRVIGILCLFSIFPILKLVEKYKFKKYKKTEEYIIEKISGTQKTQENFAIPIYQKNIHRWHNLQRWAWNSGLTYQSRKRLLKSEYTLENPIDWILYGE